jgi:hypothetical protein
MCDECFGTGWWVQFTIPTEKLAWNVCLCKEWLYMNVGFEKTKTESNGKGKGINSICHNPFCKYFFLY